jgi:hypothetical protein
MARRTSGNMNGQRYLGNQRSREVHDLDNESGRCQIDSIIAAKNDVPFIFLHTAHADGYDNCSHCQIGSMR